MLLICPECRTRYVVPDSAIGAAGRQVRCANCRHSWYQDGTAPKDVAPAPQVAAPAVAPDPAPPPAATAPERTAEPVDAGDDVGDEVAEEPVDSFPRPGFASFDEPPPAFAEPDSGLPSQFDRTTYAEPAPAPVFVSPAEPDEPRSQFAHEPPFRPRRNPAKLMTYAAIAFALLVAALGGATWYFGWLDNSFAASGKEPDLKIVLHDNLELGRDADGSPYFIASGSIVNPTAKAQRVPELLVTLKDSSGRSVYSWTMKAPTRNLAPGAKVDFSQLRRDVPLAASRISVGWALDAG